VGGRRIQFRWRCEKRPPSTPPSFARLELGVKFGLLALVAFLGACFDLGFGNFDGFDPLLAPGDLQNLDEAVLKLCAKIPPESDQGGRDNGCRQ